MLDFIKELYLKNERKHNKHVNDRVISWLDQNYLVEGLSDTARSTLLAEDRGKLCGYAFQKGDIVYRCKYTNMYIHMFDVCLYAMPMQI